MKTLIEETLSLEELDKNLYRSMQLYKPIGARGVFGGQTIGLSLAAAVKTVDPKFHVHSLHCYFLLPGDNSKPIVFKVYEGRVGKSYASRSVNASQNGKSIFSLMVSFAVPEISRLNFQGGMPSVPRPEQLQGLEETLRKVLDDPRATKYHETIRLRLQVPFPCEFKYIPPHFYKPEEGKLPTKHMMWMKTKGKLPDHITLHQCVAAYFADHELLNVNLVPFGLNTPSDRRRMTVTMMTSLDHAMWFHEPFRADEWILYEMETVKTMSGRGFSTGKFWNLEGRLIISAAQEGVIRANFTDNQVKDLEVIESSRKLQIASGHSKL